MKYLPLLALLALGACASRPQPPAEPLANAALRAQCTREANASPEVQDAIATEAGRAGYASDITTGVDQVRNAAIQKCLMAHGGLGFGGGVEIPRR